MFSVEGLAAAVNGWCDDHGISPASGQAGERLTGRNVRYYRSLGLVDPPVLGGGQGYGEKHRLQLVALRLLQAQGLPLNRIGELLFGRTVEELKRIEREGLAELEAADRPAFRPVTSESWSVTPLDDEFLLVSRRGRGVSSDVRQRLAELLSGELSVSPKRRGTLAANGGTTKHKKGK
jgi:DNA-binding transcriptional MerR regulator